MIYNYFDKAYVINIPQKELRLERLSKRLKILNIPFEVIEGIVPTSISKSIHHKGHLGAALSHIKVWEQSLRDNCNSFLVFEDDALLRDDSEDILTAAIQQLPSNWDMLFLGLNLLGKTTPISDNLCTFGRGCHFHSYGVNSKSIKYLINRGNKIVEDMKKGKRGFIDSLIISDPKLKKYHLNPILSVQEPSFSSTGGGNRLNEYFKRFSKNDFINNCQELKEWYKNNQEMYL